MRVLFALEQSSAQLALLIQQTVATASHQAQALSLNSFAPDPEGSEYQAKQSIILSPPAPLSGSGSMMRTYEHYTKISKQLTTLGKSRITASEPLRTAYSQQHHQDASAAGKGGAPLPLCLHSVLDDISNSRDQLNSIAMRYSGAM